MTTYGRKEGQHEMIGMKRIRIGGTLALALGLLAFGGGSAVAARLAPQATHATNICGSYGGYVGTYTSTDNHVFVDTWPFDFISGTPLVTTEGISVYAQNVHCANADLIIVDYNYNTSELYATQSNVDWGAGIEADVHYASGVGKWIRVGFQQIPISQSNCTDCSLTNQRYVAYNASSKYPLVEIRYIFGVGTQGGTTHYHYRYAAFGKGFSNGT
jgi:hypothetical protein